MKFVANASLVSLVFKVGEQLLTLQADVDDGIEPVKPKVLELANAVVAKLR